MFSFARLFELCLCELRIVLPPEAASTTTPPWLLRLYVVILTEPFFFDLLALWLLGM